MNAVGSTEVTDGAADRSDLTRTPRPAFGRGLRMARPPLYPLRFDPIFTTNLWGGRRLPGYLNR
ncbi:MAG TPA: hypothetical protein VGE74_11945, partial [Gemmata sp.]